MAKEWRKRRISNFRWVSRKVTTETGRETNTTMVGFLAFEISALMSRLVQLWNRLEDYQFTRVKEELANSTGIRILVSDDEQCLTELFMKEIVEELQYVARSIERFGKRCSDPVLHEFEQFVKDPVKNDFDWFGWQYRWKKMDRRVKKMQRFIAFTTELSRELEVLAEVERTLRRTSAVNFAFDGSKFHKCRKKLSWHRRQVNSLKEMTPWNRSFDYIFRLFMRSIITVIERIKIVFGVKEMCPPASAECDDGEKYVGRRLPSAEFNESIFLSRYHRRLTSEPPGFGKWTQTFGKQQPNHSPPLMKLSASKKTSQFAHFRSLSFRDCKDGGIGSPPLHDRRPIRKTSSLKLNGICEKDMEEDKVENKASSPRRINGGHYSISSFFFKDNLSATPPTSLGGAALAIHYAKMVILVEKLASAPHLIGVDDRDELFNMLPPSIRRALRCRVRSAAKVQHSSLYDPVLAAEWKSAMAKTLQWLAPLAHNMETWHSEQSFEKQHGGSRSHVLLLQTLHYADKDKTEAAIVELLVALNNICSSSEVYKKRLSKPVGGAEARRSYYCRINDEFPHFDVYAL